MASLSRRLSALGGDPWGSGNFFGFPRSNCPTFSASRRLEQGRFAQRGEGLGGTSSAAGRRERELMHDARGLCP
jgi:hypothetical protein